MSDWVSLKNLLDLTIRPIDCWPGKETPAWQRERGPFSAGLKDTLSVLRRELNALRAKSIVLQIAIREGQLRQDGLPRAGATAEHPGVILAFDSNRGSLRIWFDKFTLWQNNLRAIAMHLEHLRLAGLYGVGEDGQAYKGWTAIPAASPETQGTEAARCLCKYAAGVTAQEVLISVDVFRQVARKAQRATHPDAGGDVEEFQRVREAVELLNKRFGIR